ncbi:MAG: S1 RNA-binding domain-containing protein, partial [Anaerococcus sp.]|nr:S1 RNA-binding domain-containing protein [Anaerococcus sp.]
KENKKKNRISLGRKQLLDKPFDSFVKEHEVGDIVKGKVVNLLDFGAFVEVADGVEGLVHVSEISWDHVEKPSDELNLGDEIEVKIISLDKEEEKIGLSIKQLEEAPERPERKPRREKRENSNNNRQRRRPERSAQANFSSDADLNNNLGNLLEQALFEQGGSSDFISENDSEVDDVIDDFDSAEATEENLDQEVVDEDIVTLEDEENLEESANDIDDVDEDEEEIEY